MRIIVDEIHEHATRAVVDVLDNLNGAERRRNGEAALEPDRQRDEQLDTDEQTGARRATQRDPRNA